MGVGNTASWGVKSFPDGSKILYANGSANGDLSGGDVEITFVPPLDHVRGKDCTLLDLWAVTDDTTCKSAFKINHYGWDAFPLQGSAFYFSLGLDLGSYDYSAADQQCIPAHQARPNIFLGQPNSNSDACKMKGLFNKNVNGKTYAFGIRLLVR